jgi:hypothetical protein
MSGHVAAEWKRERRVKKLRRLYYHAMDIAGLWLWGMAVIMATAMLIFVVEHR